MKTSDIIIAHPNSDDKFEALKAFMKALKIKFEVTTEKNYNTEFVLSDQQIEMLDKRSNTPIEKYISANDSIKQLKKKYGI